LRFLATAYVATATMSTAMFGRECQCNLSRLNMTAATKKYCCHTVAFIKLKCRRY